MRKRGLLITLVLLMLLCSCKTGGTGKQSVQVFFIGSGPERTGSMLVSEDINTQNPDLLGTALEHLFAGPDSPSLISPFPANTHVVSYTVDKELLNIEVSPEYRELDGIDKTLADYAVTLTACSLPDISAVTIRVTGIPYATGPLTAEDLVSGEGESDQYEKRISIYFPDADGTFILPEYRIVTIGQESSLVRFVADELVNGPSQPFLREALPKDTKLLSVNTEGTVCTVDFSQEFLTHRPETAAQERLTVYSIVNSLSSLAGIDSVRILVEGRAVNRYLYMSLDEPISKSAEVVGTPESSQSSNTRTVTIYPAGPDGKSLTALTTTVTVDAYQTLEFVALDKLIRLESSAAYSNPFPSGVKLLSAVVYNHICRVSLSSEFALIRNPDLRELAEKSIAATLFSFDGIQEVQIIMDGAAGTSSPVRLFRSIFSDIGLFLK